MFEADELRIILDVIVQPLRAMILLGVNCGCGQTDIANLPQTSIDLDAGWIDYPRPKTGIDRRMPLWPETITAVREAIATRPQSKKPADDDMVFLTKFGNRWVRMTEHELPEKRLPLDSVAQEFSKVLRTLDINGNRNFYALRHTFETIAGESRDQVAVNAIMGHVDSSMAGVYRERISDERLIAVTDTVHNWLFSGKDDGGAA